MQETNTPPSADRPRKRNSRRGRSYRRRAKAAGLEGKEPPEDADEFRYALTRRIYMYLNNWPGCPERLCARHRGCMAPNIVCANFPQQSREEADREWRKVQGDVYRSLKAHLAAHGMEDM